MLPVVGAATAATTMFAAILPTVHNAAASGDQPRADQARAGDPGDGTYESCGAYFGFGKSDATAIDVVEFDVADVNGADGVAHAVPDDTQVVLELTNEAGDTLRCTPVEVTEEEWDDLYDAEGWVPDSTVTAWPGPGHFVYPSLSHSPSIEDFGTVTGVSFLVDGVPAGHSLVSPLDAVPLVQHQVADGYYQSTADSPWVAALIEDAAGPGASAAFSAALVACESEEDPVDSPDLRDAMNVLYGYFGWGEFDPEWDIYCGDVTNLNAQASFTTGMAAAATYVEPIRLRLPEIETTTTTSSTTVPASTTPPTDPPPTVPPPTVPSTVTTPPVVTDPPVITPAPSTTVASTTLETTTTTVPASPGAAQAATAVTATPAYTG